MSIAFVGGASHGNSLTNTIVVTYSSTAGNTLIVSGYTQGSSPTLTSVTDSASNVWQYSSTTTQSPPTVTWTNIGTGDQLLTYLAWTISAAAVTTVTVHVVGTGTNFVALTEWSGIATARGGGALTGSGISNQYAGPSINPATAGDLVIGSCQLDVQAVPGSKPVGTTVWVSPGDARFVWQLPGNYTPFVWEWGGTTGTQYAAVAQAFSPPSSGDGTPPIQVFGAF